MKKHKYKYYLAGTVALITFIAYLSSLGNEFVNWDDPEYVTENPFIRSLNISFFKWAFFNFYAANWHPLTWISHALDYAIWGLNPMGHHLTNNILHALNTFLVVLLAVRLIETTTTTPTYQGGELVGDKSSPTVLGVVAAGRGGNWIVGLPHHSPFTIHASRFTLIAAGVTGLLFGLHPIHVESVAWIAERKDLLCGLFYLLGVMMYVRYAGNTFLSFPLVGNPSEMALNTGKDSGQAGMTTQWPKFPDKHYLLALTFFFLALLSKPMAVSLPVVLIILDWYPFKRITSLKTFGTACIEKIPFIALSMLSSVVTILAQQASGAIRSVEIIPLSSRLIIAAKSLIAYVWKMLVPLNLIPLYTYPRDISLLSPNYFLPVLLVAGITLACIIAMRRQKLWMSAWGYYVVTLIPVLGIVQVGGQAMADRYTYLPGIGPFLIMGLATAWSWEKVNIIKKWSQVFKLAVVTFFILVFLSTVYFTIRQISIWKTSIDLWSYVIEKEPVKVNLAYYMRGLVYQEQGQLEKALADYNMVNALEPFHFEVYHSLGSIHEKMGQTGKAIEDYSMAIAINPHAEKALISRGILYGKAGLFNKAIVDFDKAVEVAPYYPPAYVNRGTAYFRLGQDDRALADFSRAIELDQNYAGGYVNRGSLYLKTGNKEGAVSDYRKACYLGSREGCEALQRISVK